MSQTVRVNDLDINYRFDGPEDAPAVVFSNSLSSALAMWDPQVAAVAGRWRMLRYDTRGHGKTGAPAGPYSIAMLADDVIGLMDALGIAKAAFCGLSLGGMIGQQLGLDHADRFTGLVLCDTASRWPEGAATLWAGRIREARLHGMAALAGATLERWFTEPFRATGDPEVARIRAMIEATPVPGFVGCAEAIMKMQFYDRLDAIALPTQVIVGADDPATPPAAAEDIQARIPGARLAVIPNAAHLPNVEQPAAFNETLVSFLGEL